MILHLDPSSGVPLYRQALNQIRERILGGQIARGEQLPSVRELSAEAGLNPLTVAKVYQFLEREGLVETRRGTGTFVADSVRRYSEAEKRSSLEPVIRQLVTEAGHLGVTREQALKWVESEFLKQQTRRKK
jgi:GntR family transcriptional regulator